MKFSATNLALLPLAALASVANAIDGTKYLMLFGDSYTWTGFDMMGDKPSSANPLGNPPLPGLTSTGNKDNWVTYIATEYNTSETLVYNLAFAGAVTTADLVTPYQEGVVNFDDQMVIWNDNVASKPDYAPWTAENTLAVVFIGINDIGQPYFNGTEVPVDAIMPRYWEQVQVLYDAGVRNFAFWKIPPITRTPKVLQGTQEQIDTMQSIIDDYDTQLSDNMVSFQANHLDAAVTLFDPVPAFNWVLDRPTEHGAPDNVCYNEDATSCLWYNDFHPGVAIHYQVAWDFKNAFAGSFF